MRRKLTVALYAALAIFYFYWVVAWPTMGGRLIAGFTGLAMLYAALNAARSSRPIR